MIERILDDNKGGATQERTQRQRKLSAKSFRQVGNIPLLLEVFVEFRGFSAPVQRVSQKKRADVLVSALLVEGN